MASPLFRYLDTVGDGTGTKEAIGATYTATPQAFKILAPDGMSYNIARLLVSIRDSTAWSSAAYGKTGALSVGVGIYKKFGATVLQDLCDGVPIKTNAGWASVCYDVQLTSFGAGDDFLNVRWTFAKSGLPVHLAPGESLEVLCSDDMDDLTSHTFMVQGTSKPVHD